MYTSVRKSYLLKSRPLYTVPVQVQCIWRASFSSTLQLTWWASIFIIDNFHIHFCSSILPRSTGVRSSDIAMGVNRMQTLQGSSYLRKTGRSDFSVRETLAREKWGVYFTPVVILQCFFFNVCNSLKCALFRHNLYWFSCQNATIWDAFSFSRLTKILSAIHQFKGFVQ